MRNRNPVQWNEIAEAKAAALCRAVTDLTREAFEDPEIQAEFSRWKEIRRQKKKALPEGIREKAPRRAVNYITA